MKQKLAALFFLCTLPLFGQSNSGELRLKVTDPSHLDVKTTVRILSEGNNYQGTLATTSERTLYGENQTNVLYVIDFGSLFSGNAIGPSRNVALRLTTSF